MLIPCATPVQIAGRNLKIAKNDFCFAQAVLVLRDLSCVPFPTPTGNCRTAVVYGYAATYPSQYATDGKPLFFQNALYHRRRTTGRIGLIKSRKLFKKHWISFQYAREKE